MDLKENIYALLKKNPNGLKAKSIASKLGLDRREVNSFLYSNKGTFQIDDDYVWTIKANKSKIISKEEQFRYEMIRILNESPSNRRWSDIRVVKGLSKEQIKIAKNRCEEIRNNANLPAIEAFRIIEIAILSENEFEEKIANMEKNEILRRQYQIQRQIEKEKNREDELKREYIQNLKKRGYRL